MLIILDRDGVINFDSVNYIKSPDEWIPIPGSIEAIELLTQAGHTLVIATNQSGVNRGYYSLDTLQAIHQKMLTLVNAAGGSIVKIYFCPHRPDENCDCRKPKPGMLLQIMRDFSVESNDMIFIGDSLRDYEAAMAVGCQFALVRTDNGKDVEHVIGDALVFDDLLAAARYFIG